MDFDLNRDLERFGRMAFVRAADCTEVIRRRHRIQNSKFTIQNPRMRRSDCELLEKVYRWVFVPRSLWPVDVKGLCEHLLDYMEKGKGLDEGTKELCALLPEAATEEVCEPIVEYEHAVKTGSYESLINAQFKFDSMEKELRDNAGFKADWERLRAAFPVDRYRNASGVIRRRLVQERSFRPKDWEFSWQTERERFRNVFDAFCHKWNLYGVQRIPNTNTHPPEKGQAPNARGRTGRRAAKNQWEDRPLLLKLSVNLTAFGTMIEVPKYWSFDPKRDLKWGAVTKLHRMREVKRQGPKLSAGMAARRHETARAKRLWREATEAGLKGDRRNQWLAGRLGWDARTDESRLRRLIQCGD